MEQKRGSFGSRIGFIFAVAGSAVGLANIWRFPYMAGMNGGAAYLILYLLCLFLIGFPVFISEILIGRTTRQSPALAFERLGQKRGWGYGGKLTILTGFIVSSFYCAIAGWVLGYLGEALFGNLVSFSGSDETARHFNGLVENPVWCLAFFSLFLAICMGVLFFGVQKGIERGNKVMMPALFAVLIWIVIKGVMLPGAEKGIAFLTSPDWSVITPATILAALGQSFFTLSLGQGTMVTYGSYLGKEENIVKNCLPVILMDTFVSILASIAIFTIVFSGGMEPDAGPGLIFHTLPLIFSQLSGGYLLSVLFFLLVLLASITSQISAMEPTIAYLIDSWGWRRKSAVLACAGGVFLVGIPCVLSTNLLSGATIFGETILELVNRLCTNLLIPLGGLLAVLITGWVWGPQRALNQLRLGSAPFFARFSWMERYFWFCFKYISPVLIVIVFLNAWGVFSGI